MRRVPWEREREQQEERGEKGETWGRERGEKGERRGRERQGERGEKGKSGEKKTYVQNTIELYIGRVVMCVLVLRDAR